MPGLVEGEEVVGVEKIRVQPAMPDAIRSFDQFYEENWLGYVQRAYLILRDRPAAEDVAQEVMLEMSGRWDDIVDPRPYGYRCTINRAVRMAQRNRRTLPPPRDHVHGEFEYLADVIDRLPLRMRVMVVLRYFDDLSHDQIAEVVGCRPGSVGPTLNRAIKRLSKEIER